jgi:hypothetical protein
MAQQRGRCSLWLYDDERIVFSQGPVETSHGRKGSSSEKSPLCDTALPSRPQQVGLQFPNGRTPAHQYSLHLRNALSHQLMIVSVGR